MLTLGMVANDPDSRLLVTGSRVAVVGGGPAGSLFTLYLLRYAEERGFRPDISIYQDRDFTVPGPLGCKGCAGILSMALLRNLAELGLTVPDEVVQGHIERYAVHSPYTTISISNPEQGASIVSVYRGGGPRDSNLGGRVDFDGWLLDEAIRRGASLQRQRVTTIDLAAAKPRIEVESRTLEYDLVVLAGGVNERRLTVTGGHGVTGYRRSRTSTMAQAELFAGEDEVRERLGNTAHAFLIPHSDIIFGTLVPKGPFINVSVLSSGQRPVAVAELLANDIVGDFLPKRYERACDCQPRALLTPAHGYYGDGFVAVGDAAVSRLYKDGIGSALVTAREAAMATVFHGVSRESFRRHYRPLCRKIARDNRWGQLLFTTNHYARNSRAFLLAQQRLIGDEQVQTSGPQPFTRVVWGMFTGTYSYSQMVRMAVGPTVLARLGWAVLRETVAGWFRRGAAAPRRVYVAGRKVLILGSGFGGAYVLRSLVPALNRNENVETTMVSDENFFLFSPLLHEVAMGAVETRHAAYAIRRLQWRDRFNFVQAKVDKIDLANRVVETSQGSLSYDYLVVGLGSVADTFQLNCPEGADHVFTLKTLHDSMRIRNHIIGVFERASVETDSAKRRQLLSFVIAGGGYIGIQVVTELREFLFKNLTRFYRTVPRDEIRVTMVEAEADITGRLHPKLRQYIKRFLQRSGIEVRVNSRVTRVEAGYLEINGEEEMPAGTVIWVVGVVANPVVAAMASETDDIGRVIVDGQMAVPGYPGVYAVGDCAHFVNPKTGEAIPARAHTTVRQAKVAAGNILADIRGRERKQYHYSNPVDIVSLGASRAVFRYGRFRLYGFAARLIWLVSYSLLVTGAYNRLRVAGDWFLSLVFGRDTTFLKHIR